MNGSSLSPLILVLFVNICYIDRFQGLSDVNKSFSSHNSLFIQSKLHRAFEVLQVLHESPSDKVIGQRGRGQHTALLKILIKFIRGDQRLEKVVKIRHSRPRSQVERGAGVVQKHTPALGAGCLRSSGGRPAWTWREGTAAWSRSCWRGDGGRRAPSLAAAAPRSLPSQPAAGS